MVFKKIFGDIRKILRYLRQCWRISVTFFEENFGIICDNFIGNSSDRLRKNFNRTEINPGNY